MSVRLLKTLDYSYTKQVSCLLAFFALFITLLAPAHAEDYLYAEPEDMYQSPTIARSAYEKRRIYLRDKRLHTYQRKPVNRVAPSDAITTNEFRKPIGAHAESETHQDESTSAESLEAMSPAAGPPQPLMDEPPIPEPQERVLIDVPAAAAGVKGFQFRRRPINSYAAPPMPVESTVSIPQVEISSPPEIMPPATTAAEPMVPLERLDDTGNSVALPETPTAAPERETPPVAVPEPMTTKASTGEPPLSPEGNNASSPPVEVYTSSNGMGTMKVTRMTANDLNRKLASEVAAPVPVVMPKLPPAEEVKPDSTPAAPAELNPETQKILESLPPLTEPVPATGMPISNIGIDRADPGIDLKQENVLEKEEAVGVDLNVGQRTYDVSYDLEKAYEALIAGNTEEAVRIYGKALEADPNNEMALFGLATTYHRLGILGKARPLYGKLLRLDPYNREALNNFLALVGEESPEAAILQLEKLEQANPDFSPIPAQLSILYERIGEKENAVDKMLKAVVLSPENLVYKYNLAILYDRNDRPAEAITVYRQLLAAHERGQELPSPVKTIQERLTFLDSNYKG